MSSKNYFGPIKFWIYTFSYVKLYFNHDSGVILPKKMSLLTKNWPKWSKIAIFVIFWRFFGDNIPKFSKFSKKDIIFSFLTQFYVLKDSIYNYFRKQVFGYLGSNVTSAIRIVFETVARQTAKQDSITDIKQTSKRAKDSDREMV